MLQSMLLGAVEFQITAEQSLFSSKQTGRLYVFVTDDLEKEPRTQINWFAPPPMYAIDVEKWDGKSIQTINNDSHFYPPQMNKLKNKQYRVQALLRVNLDAPFASNGAGNFISVPVNLEIDGASSKVIKLILKNTIPEKKFAETDRIKEVVIKSPSLSKFHKRDYNLKASVALPLNYDPSKKYPVLYSITGFGSDHHIMPRMVKMMGAAVDNTILVIPDASNFLGHSVFVDSENTGPWGQALLKELIPHIEKQYGGLGAKHRYLTGISSGGWSSLWLQIKYPEEFNGTWSMVPDPVDFHNFQYANLYREGENLYTDKEGNPRPIARSKGQVLLWYKDFVKMEELLGPGGQIHSFEATFSPRGEDGKPKLIFDRETGVIDTAQVEAWKKFDINLILKTQWKTLAPKLKGKLHVYAGGVDTFYLEGAVKLLKKTLADLGSDAVVEIIPGMPHRPAPGVFEQMGKAIEANL
jgi:hypothetical protein